MSSKPTYNIVLNSNFCTTATSADVNTNKEYYVDWSAILPNKKFKLRFSFMSEASYILGLYEIPIITMNFLNQGNIVACQPTYQASSSNILGCVFPTYLDPNAHLAYFRADMNFNNPIFTSRPFNNNFNVRITNNANPPILWVDDTPVTPVAMSPYVLILSFEECD